MDKFLKKFFYVVFVSFFFALCGCYQTSSDEDELRTIPVTNNPLIIPQHGSGMPGMPGPATR